MLSVLITETALNEVGKHNLFNHIQKKLNKKNINFNIVTFKSQEEEKIYSYRSLKVDVFKAKKFKSEFLNNFYIFVKLLKLNPDHLIIGGYGYLQNWVALTYAIVFLKKRTIWTGASENTTLNNNLFTFYLKKIFVSRFQNAIVYGTKAKNFLKKLGFKKEIYLTKNISDIEYFKKKINLKYFYKKINFTKKPIFLYCARLVKHKGILSLLKTFQKFDKNKYQLLLVGDGPLKNSVIRQIQSRKVNAIYLGKLSQTNLSHIMQKSDYFINPSFNDPFSRTLSEALSSGCYCISSIHDDATHDLINNNNGIKFNSKNKRELFNIIAKILNKANIKAKHKMFIKNINYNTLIYSDTSSFAVMKAIDVK